jgi:hypothetical protein
MGHEVIITVVFPASLGRKDDLSEFADQHGYLAVGDCVEADLFVEALKSKKHIDCGRKGAVFAWGITGNYTDEGKFVQTLAPLFRQLLLDPDVGPLNFEHILVFYEHEQSERAGAYEVYLEEPPNWDFKEDSKTLVIKHHPALPFQWM